MPKLNKKYYIEYWNIGDPECNVIASTFHHPCVQAFIEKFAKTNRAVVHLELIEPFRKVLYSRRLIQHTNAA